MELDIQALDAMGNCAYYESERNYERRMVKRFDFLIFLVALAVVGSVIGLIIAAAVGQYVTAAATAVGTVVTGTAMAFVIKTRGEHDKRAKAYTNLIDRKCG